ncbi:hypothetical protein MLD52_06205 [Puniceicoccaceae bacterium K14]|nr:hypothetical protein [Puniceicoccaceae bacterium K14]
MVKEEKARILEVGGLTARFFKGELRSVRLGNSELLNRVYFALRDANWDTIEQRIENIEINTNANFFEVSFESLCQQREIDFRWNCRIVGKPDGIKFSIAGRAYGNFQTNRLGFCVLHPLSCKGRRLIVTHCDKSMTESRFPYYISAHQPFKNIKAMEWVIDDTSPYLSFSGDVFEMEDQRNWSDASFKTYCTPLEQPFPVEIRKGTEVHQEIELSVNGAVGKKPWNSDCEARLEVLDVSSPLPKVGLEANGELLDKCSVERLKSLKLSHLRVEARTHEENWRQMFEERMRQAERLKLPVELVVFIEEKNVSDFEFLGKRVNTSVTLKSILPIDVSSKSTSDVYIYRIRKYFEMFFPSVPVGGGTNCYFTELNRFGGPFSKADFVAFSLNPQVHSFDDEYLVETNQALPDMVESARHIAGDLPIHISPVTLKPRFNPDATEFISLEDEKRNRLDKRHTSVFNALWTLGCIKQLAESQVESVTFFQTLGEEGVTMPDRASEFVDYVTEANEVFPVFEILKIWGDFRGGKIVHTRSSSPLEFQGLILEKEGRKMAILANYTNELLPVEFAGSSYQVGPMSFMTFDC